MKSVTRRTMLQFCCLSAAAIGSPVLLTACTRKNQIEVTADPFKSPKAFSNQVQAYNLSRADKLMEQYKDTEKEARSCLLQSYDANRIDLWLTEAEKQFMELMPQIPYVGGDKNRMTRLLVITATFAPIIQVLRDQGIATRQIGKVIVDTSISFYQKIPAPLIWYMRYRYFSDSGKQEKRQSAARSQKRAFPGDWVFEYVEGDGNKFDHGVTYSECALHKFMVLRNLEAFAPYLCLSDYAFWNALGIRASRTQTLANGGTKCDFRYIGKGTGNASPWPPESHAEWNKRYEHTVPGHYPF